MTIILVSLVVLLTMVLAWTQYRTEQYQPTKARDILERKRYEI